MRAWYSQMRLILKSLLLSLASLAGVAGVARGQTGADGTLLRVQISAAAAEARPGNRPAVAQTLQMLLKEAEKAHDDRATAEAQLALARIVLEADYESGEVVAVEPMPLLESALEKCSAFGWKTLRMEALELHAQCLGEIDEPVSACRELELAASLGLDLGLVDAAVDSLLQAGRVYANLGHAVRVRQIWTLLQLVRRQRHGQYSTETAARIDRAAVQFDDVLALTPAPQSVPEPGVLLQPLRSAVVVANSEAEDGRTRFLLINQSAFSTEGDLSILADKAGVKSWQAGQAGHFVHLDPAAKKQATNRHLRLLPGQQLRIFLEHLPSGRTEFADKVALTWTDADGARQADCEFRFDAAASGRSQVINGSIVRGQAAWPAPLYHELFFRGNGSVVENFLARTSVPCRLEMYREATGELVAVDAQGDGVFTGPGDHIAPGHDRDAEGRPDLILTGLTSGSLEIFALPLQGDAQSAALTIQLADYSASPPRWREDATDSVVAP